MFKRVEKKTPQISNTKNRTCARDNGENYKLYWCENGDIKNIGKSNRCAGTVDVEFGWTLHARLWGDDCDTGSVGDALRRMDGRTDVFPARRCVGDWPCHGPRWWRWRRRRRTRTPAMCWIRVGRGRRRARAASSAALQLRAPPPPPPPQRNYAAATPPPPRFPHGRCALDTTMVHAVDIIIIIIISCTHAYYAVINPYGAQSSQTTPALAPESACDPFWRSSTENCTGIIEQRGTGLENIIAIEVRRMTRIP